MDETQESGSSLAECDGVTQRIVLHVYDDESKEFTSLTTYHGMIRVYSSETWPSRIFWSLVVVTCLTLFMIHSGLMLFFYHSKPTFFKTTEMPLGAEQLPSVTICRVSRNEWKKQPGNHPVKDILAIANVVLNGGSFSATEIERLALLEKNYSNITGEKFKIKQILMDSRLPCERTIVSLYMGGRRIENHCHQSYWALTEIGYCSVFKWEHIPSAMQSFRVNVVSEIDEQVMFRVNSANTANILKADGNYVPRGKTAKLAIWPKMKIHLKAGNWGDCIEAKTNDHFSDAGYSRDSCEMNCSVEHYIRECGCIPFFAELEGRSCTLTETIECRQNGHRTCHCSEECERMDYTQAILSYAKNDLRNLSSIEIRMISTHFRRDEQLKRIKPVDLLSYVAGSMGLLLGMSCITLLEIFIYLFKSVWGVFNDQRHKTYYLENLLGLNEGEGTTDSHEEIVITTKTRADAHEHHTMVQSPTPTVEEESADAQITEEQHSRVEIAIVRHSLARRRSSYAYNLNF